MTRIMVDIETRALSPRAAILQIGAVVIDNALNVTQKVFDACIDAQDSARYGEVDPGTDEWWAWQSDQVSRKVWSGTETSASVTGRFQLWMLGQRDVLFDTEVWAQGPQFDLVALRWLFKQHGLSVPWKYNEERDLRTARKLIPVHVERDEHLPAHDALADAVHQANILREVIWRSRHKGEL